VEEYNVEEMWRNIMWRKCGGILCGGNVEEYNVEEMWKNIMWRKCGGNHVLYEQCNYNPGLVQFTKIQNHVLYVQLPLDKFPSGKFPALATGAPNQNEPK